MQHVFLKQESHHNVLLLSPASQVSAAYHFIQHSFHSTQLLKILELLKKMVPGQQLHVCLKACCNHCTLLCPSNLSQTLYIAVAEGGAHKHSGLC